MPTIVWIPPKKIVGPPNLLFLNGKRWRIRPFRSRYAFAALNGQREFYSTEPEKWKIFDPDDTKSIALLLSTMSGHHPPDVAAWKWIEEEWI